MIPGCRSGKARGKHLGPRTPGTRRSARCPPNSGRFTQTPCESSEGRANALQNSAAAAVRLPARVDEQRGRGGSGLERRAQQSARTRSQPRAPAGLNQPRAAPGEAGDSGDREDRSCSRPPQLRSPRRGSVLPPGPGQPIKQNTNVTIFFLLIASPDISARWEEKKKMKK